MHCIGIPNIPLITPQIPSPELLLRTRSGGLDCRDLFFHVVFCWTDQQRRFDTSTVQRGATVTSRLVAVWLPGGEGHELRKGRRRLREGLGLLYNQEVGRHLVNEALETFLVGSFQAVCCGHDGQICYDFVAFLV